ncbi:MAG: hypothetical protein LBK08_12985 [Treponema sp.]|jgi:hypothetical protein|nr:hypothetical protein [Treponema sp.]
MKRSIYVFILLFFSEFIYSQEIITFYEGRISFQRPDHIILWEERPMFNSVFDAAHYWIGKTRLKIDIHDEKTLRNEPPTIFSKLIFGLLNEQGGFTNNSLLNLFNRKIDFIINDFKPYICIRDSYKSLVYNNVIIGETFLNASHINFKVPAAYSYTISFIVDDKIINLYLSFFADKKFNRTSEMDDFFISNGDNYNLRDENSIFELYDCLVSDNYKKLPIELQFLQEGWELILDTLMIDNKKLDRYY